MPSVSFRFHVPLRSNRGWRFASAAVVEFAVMAPAALTDMSMGLTPYVAASLPHSFENCQRDR